MGTRLEALMLYYLDMLEKAKAESQREGGDPYALKAVKYVNYIVITDGAPSTLLCTVLSRTCMLTNGIPSQRTLRRT